MSPRVAFVTGCSNGGIGSSLCQEFAAQGCKVYASARSLESMSQLDHPSIEKLVLDVTRDDDVERVVQHIADSERRIDIVVNNAGIPSFGPLIDQTLDYAKQVYETNVLAVLRVCKAVIPVMAERKTGTIVNIGSIVGETPTPWNGLYSTSKSAVQTMSDVLWMECKPFNISVMHVSPGAVQSNISKNGTALFELPESSLYTAYLPNIITRINASQKPGVALPTEQFAKLVVANALKQSPPRYLTLGGNSLIFQVFKWLPRVWALSFFWRIYSTKK